jgi:hypothetical protein
MHGLGTTPQRQTARLAGAVNLLCNQFADDAGGNVGLPIRFWCPYTFARRVAALSGAIGTPFAIRAGITNRLIQRLAAAIALVGDVKATGFDFNGFF